MYRYRVCELNNPTGRPQTLIWHWLLCSQIDKDKDFLAELLPLLHLPLQVMFVLFKCAFKERLMTEVRTTFLMGCWKKIVVEAFASVNFTLPWLNIVMVETKFRWHCQRVQGTKFQRHSHWGWIYVVLWTISGVEFPFYVSCYSLPCFWSGRPTITILHPRSDPDFLKFKLMFENSCHSWSLIVFPPKVAYEWNLRGTNRYNYICVTSHKVSKIWLTVVFYGASKSKCSKG